MIDGHPDLCSYSLETLRYAVKLYLQEKLGKEQIEVSDAGGNYSGWFNSADKVGGVDVKFIVEGESERFLRIQLRKIKDGWKVARELKGDELYAAHPLNEVNKDDLSEYFLYLASQRLEKDLQQEYSNGNYRTEMHTPYRLSRKHGLAQVELTYWLLGLNKRYKKNYLLRRAGDDWIVERRLSDDEKLNVSNGTIE